MLSYAAWQTRYGKRADVIGQTVTLDGNPNTIVGALPRDFHFAPAEPAEFWTAEHDESDCRGSPLALRPRASQRRRHPGFTQTTIVQWRIQAKDAGSSDDCG